MAKFTKGKSGNPKGRPRGVQTQTRLRVAIAKDVPGIIEALVRKAKRGDTAAAKLLLDRVVPLLRPVDTPAPVPVSRDLGDAGRDILAAIGTRELGPETGAKILQAVGVLARIIEVDKWSDWKGTRACGSIRPSWFWCKPVKRESRPSTEAVRIGVCRGTPFP